MCIRDSLFHSVSDQLADLCITGRNGTDTGDILAAVDFLAVCLDGLNSGVDSLLRCV